MNGRDEEGMILVNVLVFVALAAAVVMLMISAQEAALTRAIRLSDASRARAAALGGELSAITALRRDALLGQDSDDRTEAWAQLEARGSPIRGGSFDLTVADAQDRPNINMLMKDDPVALALADRIAARAGLGHDLVVAAAQFVRAAGPLSSLVPLGAVGIPAERAAALAGLVTALPTDAKINLNAASEPVLALLLENPATAHQLVELRARKGRLTSADLGALNLSTPPMTGFTSDSYWVVARVRIGDTSQTLTSLLARKREGDRIEVRPVGRWWGGNAPIGAPVL